MNRKMRRANVAQSRKPLDTTVATLKNEPLHDSLRIIYSRHQAGETRWAYQECQTVLTQYPDSADAHNMLGIIAFALKDMDTAFQAMEKAIQINPRSVDYYNNYGVFLATAQQLPKALDIFEKAIQVAPKHTGALGNAGRCALSLEQYDRALRHFLALEKIAPNDAVLLTNIGMAYSQKHEYAKSIEYYNKAITANPNCADAYSNMSMAYGRLQEHERAFSTAQKAIELDPTMPQAYNNLGTAYQYDGNGAQAAAMYRKAIALDAKSHLYWGNLANALWSIKQYEEAIAAAEEALRLNPNYAEAFNTLGNVYEVQGLAQAALDAYLKGVQLNPTIPEIQHNLGMIWYKHRDLEKAIQHYQKALTLRPNYYDAVLGLANVYGDQAKRDLCLDAYATAYRLRPSDNLRLRQALAPFIFPNNHQEVVAYQDNVRHVMAQLAATNYKVENPINDIGMTNFFSTYHGVDNRQFYEEVCRFYRQSAPILNYVAPHCQTSYQLEPGQKIRLGFISMYFRDHAVTWAYRGIIALLPRAHIEITLFSFSTDPDDIKAELQQMVDHSISLGYSLEEIYQVFSEHPQDILVYTDIGMAPPTYFSAFARLAPIQIVTTGHPDTTGIDTIDYFISADGLESANAQKYYSEELVRLPGMYVYYYRPHLPEQVLPRAAFGLNDDENIYLCPQSFFKIGRDMDALFIKILQQDPKGRLVIMSQDSYWTTRIVDRLYNLEPNIINQFTILPYQPFDKFMNLLMISDVMLDTNLFNGGSTSFQGLSVGTPIITLPGDLMRQRCTKFLYDMMDIHDCIAQDQDDYVRIAIEIATNKERRAAISAQILERNHCLFEQNMGPQGWADFIIKVAQEKLGFHC
jgi:protein O-GlcNAc transferase